MVNKRVHVHSWRQSQRQNRSNSLDDSSRESLSQNNKMVVLHSSWDVQGPEGAHTGKRPEGRRRLGDRQSVHLITEQRVPRGRKKTIKKGWGKIEVSYLFMLSCVVARSPHQEKKSQMDLNLQCEFYPQDCSSI